MVASGPSFKVFSRSLLPVLKTPKHETNDVKKNDEAPLSFLVLLISLLCEYYDRSLFINRSDNFKKNMRSLSVNGTQSYPRFAHLLEKSTYITQISFGNKLNCVSIDHDLLLWYGVLNSSVMKILRALIFISLVIWLDQSSNHVINS